MFVWNFKKISQNQNTEHGCTYNIKFEKLLKTSFGDQDQSSSNGPEAGYYRNGHLNRSILPLAPRGSPNYYQLYKGMCENAN